MLAIDSEVEKKEILQKYRNLLKVCKPKTQLKEKKLIRKAFDLALDAHKDMRRKSGEPYIYHPLAVANIAAGEIGLGTTSVICSLLHDVIEDTDYTIDDIRPMFGDTAARIIDGLTKIKGIFDQSSPSLQAENFRKMLLTLSDDVRVILIKLADRLHNMRTLDSLPPTKQLKVASETIFLYAPLAHRLGLYAIKSELEDLALKYTEPEIFRTITQKLKDTEAERKKFVNQFISPLKKALNQEDLNFNIIGRTKSVHSIWEKMKKKGIPFEEVYDLFAIRIIIDTPQEREKSDCWKAYSIVTDHYRPKADRLRDWISIPKANGYEALHTTAMSKAGKWVEVQIRTERMDEIAERGYAAHWKYKDADSPESALDKWLIRIRDLLQSPESNALDFLDDFKLNLFSDEIFIFTPKGELRTLPINATVLDFAYSIHSQIGNNCIGAKVNHKLEPLSYKLKSGDQIEIITSKKQIPKEDWIDYVITARAKGQIKSALKDIKKEFSDVGREKLEKFFAEAKVEFSPTNISKFQAYNKIHNLIDFYYLVAKEKICAKELKEYLQINEKNNWLRYIRRTFIRKNKATQKKSLEEAINKQIRQKPETLLLDEDIEEIKYKLSSCCNPIPGDQVFGYISPNGKIFIHHTNCEDGIQLMSRFGHRIVKAKWVTKEAIAFLAGIRINGIDKVGILNNITNIISQELSLNMRSMNLESHDGLFEGEIMLYVNDTQHLKSLIGKLKKINGISKVVRIT